mgnify:CR=1 FL=1
MIENGCTLWIPFWLPAGLNGPNGLMRGAWQKRKKEKEKILLMVLQDGGDKLRAPVPCRIVWTRYYCGTPMDLTNAAASFKHLEDVLVKLEVLVDDSPKYVRELVVRQVRVKSRISVGCRVDFETVM